MKINKDQIRNYVEERYFERGQSYFDDGMVILGMMTENTADAYCIGSRVYKVNLALENNKLSGDCTCPAFDDFGPCKHIAAAALAVMEKQTSTYHSSSYAAEMLERYQAVREQLRGLSKEELIDLIEQFVDTDELEMML